MVPKSAYEDIIAQVNNKNLIAIRRYQWLAVIFYVMDINGYDGRQMKRVILKSSPATTRLNACLQRLLSTNPLPPTGLHPAAVEVLH